MMRMGGGLVPVPPRHSIHSGFMTQTNLYSREGQAQGPRPPRHPPPVPTAHHRFPHVSLKSAAVKSHPAEVDAGTAVAFSIIGIPCLGRMVTRGCNCSV